MKVRVYYNLHSELWSVMDAKTRRVIGHASHLIIDSVEFKVSEAGRQRCLREKKKNVHAFVVGTLQGALWISASKRVPSEVRRACDWSNNNKVNNAAMLMCMHEGRRVTYNPYKWPTFVTGVDGFTDVALRPVHKARCVYMERNQVHAFEATGRGAT